MDPAARIATAVAVPVALVAGVLVYFGMRPAPAKPPRPASTAPVAMAAPALAERTATVCRALFARLPDRLGDLQRRPVTAGPEQNAAYGDPAVTLACGAPVEEAPQGAQLLEIERVCWYAKEGPDAAVWSVQGREVPLVVTVPNRYTGQNLVDLGGPITAAIAETRSICV
ncbi:hypothetical protein Val02_26350 [Virgisporangium aliadipatigenens]|uniref:DUF3515 domain-containing protein n=1 Tax=Virgisporangium aliadipatigenens TaxID=741659 RepID=A0A8J3YI66_9ACTN|nr:DUF3515 domain-containing protein [Virgisporangium aliadipatigenens]GIJ45749.1 hypothetical protein Val02_26350 [Virgisporangium aliadipatigenens]